MSTTKEYREIYEREIYQDFKKNIKVYKIQEGINRYQPLSHNCMNVCTNCNHDCYKDLGKLMRKNIIFYCYGEDEVVENYRNGLFTNLEKATKFAYMNRLPKRQSDQDGLLSEVLMDVIIQSVVPNAYKLAVRTIFRQNDNNEIKGYDLTYFTDLNGKISLWLGQAKLGSLQYCKEGIIKDLQQKYTELYMANQLFFLADKPVGITEQGKRIANLLNQLNMLNVNENQQYRTEKLIKFLKDQNIDICIPCLLAYEKKYVYRDRLILEQKIDRELKWAKKHFEQYFSGLDLDIILIFIVFPIDDVRSLRGVNGFYDGLC